MIALAVLALTVTAGASPARAVGITVEGTGSVAMALGAFMPVCRAHPGDPEAQRAAARVARPDAFRREAAAGAAGFESWTAYPLQLSLFEDAGERTCAVLTPLSDAPGIDAAAAQVGARLGLGAPALEGGLYVWRDRTGGWLETITFALPVRADARGVMRATVQLTLTAKRAN